MVVVEGCRHYVCRVACVVIAVCYVVLVFASAGSFEYLFPDPGFLDDWPQGWGLFPTQAIPGHLPVEKKPNPAGKKRDPPAGARVGLKPSDDVKKTAGESEKA